MNEAYLKAVTRQIVEFNDAIIIARRKAIAAEDAKQLLIAMLEQIPIERGLPPAIVHHIINTEGRKLSEEERSWV